MRFTIGYALAISFFVLILMSDFYLAQAFKTAISKINQKAQAEFGIKPLSIGHLIVMTTLLWLPPFLLTTTSFKLEYRLLLTLVYWILFCSGVWQLISYKTAPEMAGRIIPYLLGGSFAVGLFLLPAVILILDAIGA